MSADGFVGYDALVAELRRLNAERRTGTIFIATADNHGGQLALQDGLVVAVRGRVQNASPGRPRRSPPLALQITPSVLSLARSSTPSESQSLKTSALCWPSSGAGRISVGDFDSCTGLPGIVNSPQPGCWMVWIMPRAFRC